MQRLRHEYLLKQSLALVVRARQLIGVQFRFVDEAKLMYDIARLERLIECAEPQLLPEEYFQGIIEQIAAKLPGEGEVAKRYEQFRNGFVIPKPRLDDVFTAAINECKCRTYKYMKLPEKESFVVEYVTNKPWSGYNWYKGENFSIIQVNTDLPIFIDRAVDLAAHEGYPGHHVYNMLLEQMSKARNWPEFCVYPLYSPQSLIAEGTANFGIEVAFPAKERILFEKEVLFPLAGLDATKAEQYYQIQELVGKLNHAGNLAAKKYLDGEISAEKAVEILNRYTLMEPSRAQQRLRFIEKYRSYVINYNIGLDLVRQYVNSQGGTPDNIEQRWRVFYALLCSPRLPSSIRVPHQ